MLINIYSEYPFRWTEIWISTCKINHHPSGFCFWSTKEQSWMVGVAQNPLYETFYVIIEEYTAARIILVAWFIYIKISEQDINLGNVLGFRSK